MWSIYKPRPLGGVPMRRITLFVSAILMALFSTLIINMTSAQAQTASEGVVTWSGETLQYDGYTLEKYDTQPSGGEFPNLAGTACENNGPIFYSSIYPDAIYKRNNPAYQEDRYWMHVICLEKGSDGSDKSQPINATLLDYSILKANISADDVRGGALDSRLTYSIQVTPEGATDNTGSTESATTCDSKNTHGLGWVICPVTNFLASAMDFLYGVLENFLVVAPIVTKTDSSLYRMWNMVRNIANILFVIGFLIIIYSQITSVGLSNYGIKRLLPRLVIAAVLVNISYWITAISVDLSNILGVAIKELLNSARDNIQGSMADAATITWQQLAGFSLAGGVAAVGIGGAVLGVFATAGGSLFLILPALVGVLVSALVAIIILSARQALITILIIIAPLAFVAYLLPSTEKYFERWRGLFMTMLLVYPAFSLIFCGAQLAGLAIISAALDSANNDSENVNTINLVVLGMVVQVVPLVITPLLIRLSGSLLGRIAGIVNNPNKGLIDGTRKYAEGRRDMQKYRQIARFKDGKPVNNNPFAMAARWNAKREINNQHKLKAYQSGTEALYEQSKGAHQVHAQNATSEMIKSEGEDRGKAEFAREIAHREALRRLYYQQQVAHDAAETENKAVGALYEGLKAAPDKVTTDIDEQKIGNDAKDLDQRARSIASREATAKQVQERAYNKAITENTKTDLREFAGFNEIDPHGVARIVNMAQEAEAKTYETLVEAGRRTLQREEATLEELHEIIKNGTSSNVKFAHFKDDTESRSAALRQYMATAPMFMRQNLAAELDISLNAKMGTQAGILRSELAGALKQSGVKPFYISNTRLNEIAEGTLDPALNYDAGVTAMIQETLNAKGLGAQSMVQVDRDDLKAVLRYLKDPRYGFNSLNLDAQNSFKKSLRTAFEDNRYRSQMDKREIELTEIWNTLGDMGDRPE